MGYCDTCHNVQSPNSLVTFDGQSIRVRVYAYGFRNQARLLVCVSAVSKPLRAFRQRVVAETDAAGATRQQTFTAPDGIKGDARAELTWFPASRTQLKLCWQVLFTSQWRDEMYLTLVSADTGEILYRRNLTTEGSAITCRVYTNASPTPFLPGWSTPNTTQPTPGGTRAGDVHGVGRHRVAERLDHRRRQ
jgi:hypothetical protein